MPSALLEQTAPLSAPGKVGQYFPVPRAEGRHARKGVPQQKAAPLSEAFLGVTDAEKTQARERDSVGIGTDNKQHSPAQQGK